MSSDAGDPALHSVVTGLKYGEGLRWHDGALWFSDMLGHQVLRYEPGGAPEVVAEVRSPSGIGFAPDGAAYVVCRDEDALYRFAPGPVEPVVDLAAIGMLRANDMVIDGSGRCYVGCLGKQYEAGDEDRAWDERAPGALALIDLSGPRPGGGAIVARGLGCPNGMVVPASGDTLYLAETYGKRVLAYDIGARGELTGRHTFAQLDSMVDGMAGDTSGMWVGAGNRFVRVDMSGRVVDEVPAPAGATAIACALGGATGRTLFAAVAVMTMEEFTAGNARSEILGIEVREPAAGWP